jgi:AcrR family transcriptional regulator
MRVMSAPAAAAPGGARGLRRDALANRERLLEAAAVAVRREGEKVPSATIARDAGVGVGTLYRHYPTRQALLAALVDRSYRIALEHATRAGEADEPAIASIARFLEATIERWADLVLPLHGGPVSLDPGSVALRTAISDALDGVLLRGRRDGTIRADVTSIDIIIEGAQLAQPLPHVPDWERIARRLARVYLDGLAAIDAAPLPGPRPTRAELERGFAASGPVSAGFPIPL